MLNLYIQKWWTGSTKRHQIWSLHRVIICTLGAHFNLHICCTFRNNMSKATWVDNWGQILHLFNPCKNHGRWAKCPFQGFKFSWGPNHWYTFGEGLLLMLRDSTHFPTQILKVGTNSPQFWDGGTKLHQILGGHTTLIDAPIVCLRCQVFCFISEQECLKIQN